MKKLKFIAGAIIRGTLMLAPGIFFFCFARWLWPMIAPLINVLAAVGFETLFLLAFVIVTVTMQAYKMEKAKKSETAEVTETPTEK